MQEEKQIEQDLKKLTKEVISFGEILEGCHKTVETLSKLQGVEGGVKEKDIISFNREIDNAHKMWVAIKTKTGNLCESFMEKKKDLSNYPIEIIGIYGQLDVLRDTYTAMQANYLYVVNN